MRHWFALIFFSVIGIVAILFLVPRGDIVAPQAVFYAVLVINTFFSIRFFSTIIPLSIRQILIDTVITILYILLAVSIGYSLLFLVAAAALFVVAALKYAIELGSTSHPSILRTKIWIDLGAVIPLVLAFVWTLYGFPVESAWVLAAFFLLANVYLLAIKPLYRS